MWDGPSTVELKDDAARISAWIEYAAQKAAHHQDYASKYGIVPQQAMSLFIGDDGGLPKPADWLRGAVTALMPRGWAYRIDEDTSGRGNFVLTTFWPASNTSGS